MSAVADPHQVPAWLIRVCRWLSSRRGLVVSSVSNIVLSLVATWFFTATIPPMKNCLWRLCFISGAKKIRDDSYSPQINKALSRR